MEWCWELEERRQEKKSALRARPATGMEKGEQRAKLWRGGEVRRVWGVRRLFWQKDPSSGATSLPGIQFLCAGPLSPLC